MNAFLRTKIGMASVAIFVCVMALMLSRVAANRRARRPVPAATKTAPVPTKQLTRSIATAPAQALPASESALAENATYLDQYGDFDRRTREDRDRQGNPITRRVNPGTPADAGRVTEMGVPSAALVVSLPPRGVLRLQGRAAIVAPSPPPPASMNPSAESETSMPGAGISVAAELSPARPHPRRFNPYGSIIKCELVFTLDSTDEETPLIAVVMEPVHNNGLLVIPAGAELHGTARPDRLRDRIFSGQDWILVFPREHDRPNGRQLNVKGVALDRVEPDVNGMTWGLTDGSYGLEGQVIRTLREEEIKRFVATFLAAATETLEARQTSRGHEDAVRNTPQNALLQGLAANLSQFAQEVSEEVAKHGVFIRVPAGHQFYFYPMQIIDPDVAGISSNVAVVK